MIGSLDGASQLCDPLACFDIETLLEGAARLRPGLLALADDADALTFEEANRRADVLAAHFSDIGLIAGETILIAAGAPAASFVALVAGLRAELRVALAPAWTKPAAAGRMALAAAAAAILVAPSAGLGEVEVWLEAAATSVSTRLVCTLGGVRVDGAVQLDPTEDPQTPPRFSGPKLTRSEVCTFDREGALIAHAQRTLLAAALDIVARSRMGLRRPIICTLPPASFVGLAAGPIAALLAGASLAWRLPFDSESFLRSLDAAAPVCLVAPIGLASSLQDADLLRSEVISSLVLVSRSPDWRSPDDPPILACAPGFGPIVDVYAFGERAAAPEARDSDGRPATPANETHYLDFDGSRILALDWTTGAADATPRLEGAAVTSD